MNFVYELITLTIIAIYCTGFYYTIKFITNNLNKNGRKPSIEIDGDPQEIDGWQLSFMIGSVEFGIFFFWYIILPAMLIAKNNNCLAVKDVLLVVPKPTTGDQTLRIHRTVSLSL